MSTSNYAIIFSVISCIIIVFQGCLALGLPWGAASMGGKFPGKYPPKMRVVAVLNMLLLGFIAAIVLAKADLYFLTLKPISSIGIWFVVGFSAIGTILNTITPSKIERIWAPLILIQLLTSFAIAMA
jgi:hypothetical protein